MFVVSCSKPNPRKSGIGFRLGYTLNNSEFRNDNASFVRSDISVNGDIGERFPLFYQSDEELTNNYAYSLWYIDFSSNESIDIPPSLDNAAYIDLISNSNGGSVILKSNKTYINEFSSTYPQYSSLIEKASEPSLSIDTKLNTITFGRAWGVFLPISEKHRIYSLGLGLGLSYSEGYNAMNLCDPYIITTEEIHPPNLLILSTQKFRRGLCQNKYNLYHQNISNFGLSGYLQFKFYQYVEENYELVILEIDGYAAVPIFLSLNSENEPLPTASMVSYYANIVSIIFYF